MFPSATRSEIEKYSDNVRKNKIRCELSSCPVCGTPSEWLRRHDARLRKFYLLCGMFVEVVVCFVVRWRCANCKKKRVQQPPFALPNKRYTRESILGFSGAYVGDDAASYRKVVIQEDGTPLFYASTTGDDSPDDRALAPSSPYRWITFLGSLKEVARCAYELILQQDPASTICRDIGELKVCGTKYVKTEREPILKRCLRLLHLEAAFRALFFSSIFPTIATKSGWG